jgi:hypothetical protein
MAIPRVVLNVVRGGSGYSGVFSVANDTSTSSTELLMAACGGGGAGINSNGGDGGGTTWYAVSSGDAGSPRSCDTPFIGSSGAI